MALMPRNKLAQAKVVIRQTIKPRRWVNWAHRTAQAIVKLLNNRTTVLTAPSVLSRYWWASANTFGVPGPVDGVEDEQPAEKQDFRDQEQPHPQLARIELLLRRFEVVGEERRMFVIGVLFRAAVRRARRRLIHG
jgi:hypothetical protein